MAEAKTNGRIPVGPGIVIAPIYGDSGNEVRNFLKNAVTDAGLVCVEASDDMWTAIMKELGFNEAFKDLIDETTMTVINRHFASKILLYGRVRVEPARDKKGRPAPANVELSLHADDLQTRQHVWGRDFVPPPLPEPPPPKPDVIVIPPDQSGSVVPADVWLSAGSAELVAAPLSVRVSATGPDASSRALASGLDGILREKLAAAGYAVLPGEKTGDKEDVKIDLKAVATPFDRELDYVRFDGKATISASLPGDRNRLLGGSDVSRRGVRAMGEEKAIDNLRDAFDADLDAWIGSSLAPDRLRLSAETFVAVVTGKDDRTLYANIASLREGLAKLPGVADARQISVENAASDGSGAFRRVTWRVVFRPDQIPDGLYTALVAKNPDLFAPKTRSGK